jgi:hypothetical protein
MLNKVMEKCHRYSKQDLSDWKSMQSRVSLYYLIVEASEELQPYHFKLNVMIEEMFQAMLKRIHDIESEINPDNNRKLVPENERRPYDPSTGVADTFSSSGSQFFNWPNWTGVANSTRADCDCKKNDWLNSNTPGQSEGVLTFMCMKSGVVVGTTFLTSHEGQKDASSALYCYHPNLKHVKSVVCDTPCMHASYLIAGKSNALLIDSMVLVIRVWRYTMLMSMVHTTIQILH